MKDGNRLGIWCEIVCGTCASPGPGQWSYGTMPRRELKAAARRRRWLFKDGEAFCSPACKDSHDREVSAAAAAIIEGRKGVEE